MGRVGVFPYFVDEQVKYMTTSNLTMITPATEDYLTDEHEKVEDSDSA